MGTSDLKFFLLIAIVGGGAFFAFFWNWNNFHWVHRDPPQRTITFVPKGTPGAITWEEYQRRQRSGR